MTTAVNRPSLPSRFLTLMDWTPERIRALRRRLHLTQAEMAQALGYTRHQSVSELENYDPTTGNGMQPSGAVAILLKQLDHYGRIPLPETDEE